MLPDSTGHYGEFGGKYIPEVLMGAIEELEACYEEVRHDGDFHRELSCYLLDYVGRKSPLYFARRLSQDLGRGKIYLKREDLNHTGSHKINNTLGQVLMAKRMAKKRIIAETGAGQHGVATATAAALFGLECEIFMGEEDIKRQALNVFRMKILGSKVTPVKSGSKTLKDAMNEALRNWATTVENTFYVIGSVAGPHPYPLMVRDFQSVIGREAREQILEKEGRLPDTLIACVGGGSNAMGLFHPFYEDKEVRFIGVEAAGDGISSGRHSASLSAGEKGVLHGSLSYILQNDDGQILEAHSLAAGLDYPGVGPEHCFYKDSGRAVYENVTDNEALVGFQKLSELEGIIPALESAHALGYLYKNRERFREDEIIIVNLSGRGDKDAVTAARILRGEEVSL